MTSYSQSDYYFNEIDALSCNNRPISSTLRSKSTYNAYESQTEDETASYDLYGNQEYNDGSSCDSYNHHQRSTSTMSNAGNYSISIYSNDYSNTQCCKNVITTDNLMYHRDACSGDSSDRYDIYSTLNYGGDYDNLKGECINYGSSTAVEMGNGRPFTSLGDSNNKLLPQVPGVQQGAWDGMYGSGQYRQSNVSLPSTPTFRYNCGSVGGREMGFDNGDWDRGFVANGVKSQLNGHRNYEHSFGELCGKRPPERILPLPQSQTQTCAKKSLKQQFFQDNSDNMATTKTSMSPYRNSTNLDYKRAMPVSSAANQNLPSHYNLYYDNGSIIEPRLSNRETDYNNSYSTHESHYSIEPRPHTAMQTTDEYNEFGLNSMDNMSTYSDTNVPIGATTTHASQQKLQDLRKCRYSIIMAMTTASVIASGETRIPQHLLKKPLKTTSSDVLTTNGGLSKAVDMTSVKSYGYDDCSGSGSGFVYLGSNNKNNSISGSNNIMSCAYTNVTMLPGQSSATSVTLPSAASSSMLLLSSASPIVAADSVTSSAGGSSSTAITTTASHTETSSASVSLAKNLTSRKLPKHHTGRGLAASKQLPQSPPYTLSQSNALASKTLPNVPQTTSLKATTSDTVPLDNINMTSCILSTTLTSTTTPSSLSSTFSLFSYQGSRPLVTSSFINLATTTDAISATAGVAAVSTLMTTKTTAEAAADLLPPNNNNNTMHTDMKNYDSFNNYKNNNFFINNILNTDDKYSIEAFRDDSAAENAETIKEQEQLIYHLSTTPSRLGSLANTHDDKDSLPFQQSKTAGTAYDSLISMSTLRPAAATVAAATTTKETITTSSSVAKTTSSSSTTLESGVSSIFDSDYKTTYHDYDDYLKPYTLPTYSTRNTSNSNNTTNLQFTLTRSNNIISSSSSNYLPYPSLDIHTDYLTFSSSIATSEKSTHHTSTLTSSSTVSASVSTSENANASTILAINNRGLNNITTALNLSDNNTSRKSSISSPVSKVASRSGSVAPITSISSSAYANAAETTTTITTLSSNDPTPIASSLSNTLAASYFDHVPKSTFTLLNQDRQLDNNKSIISLGMKIDTQESASSSSSLYMDDYLKEYKLDFISPSITTTRITTTTTISSPTTHTSATTRSTSSSSTLNKSWPTSTIMANETRTTATTITTQTTTKSNDNCFNNINNNEVANLTTTSVLSYTPDCVFTTTSITSPAAELTPTSTQDSLTTTTAAADTPSIPALYADYLKDYSTVTAASSTSFVSETTDKPSQDLPAYIMDFLITSKSNEFDSSNYLNLYKIEEADTITADPITLDISSSKATITASTTTNINNIISNSQSFINDIPTTTTTHDDISDVYYTSAATTTAVATVPLDKAIPASTSDSFTIATSTSASVTTTIKTDNQPTANTALMMMVDFDDNFYNSFSVNLNSLMTDTNAGTTSISDTTVDNYASITADASLAPATGSEISKASYATASIDEFPTTSISQSSFSVNNLDGSGSQSTDTAGSVAAAKSTSIQITAAAAPPTTIHSSITTSKSLSSSSQKPTTAGVKAASMLGGLSQSLIGGLDGVLAAAGSNEPQQQKRGFGFGLASKFVPSVGGLLSSATKSTAPSTTATTQQPKTVSAAPMTTHIPQATTACLTGTYFEVSSMSDGYYNNVTTASDIIITTSNNQETEFVVSSTHTSDMYANEKDVSLGGLYYNSSQPTYYHMTSSLDYAKDEMANHSDQLTMYDEVVTAVNSGGVSKEYYADDDQAFDMYGGYSEYESVTTSGQLIESSVEYVTASGTAPAPTTASQAPTSTSMQSGNSTTVTAAKKATSSLFSSLTNVASQISQQTSSQPPATTATAITCGSTTTATSTKTSSSGGGMFGSIFGKAAAAMQTATQVVNQGASMASTKVQKNLQPTSAVSLSKRVSTTEEPTTCTAATVTVTTNNYQRSIMVHQDSLASPYASSLGGDDYDNSNIPQNADGEFLHHLDEEEYYYANQSQPSQLIQQQSQQKLLPTVPPGGGSTGKKLPTINDKSGCLVKQQPTEIYEEDPEVLDNKSQPYLKKVPTYDIDSEQADYYMDTQPVAPSARHMAANGYYEHTNGGSYDYRDDYFNEEDELKYLEKEKILDNKQQQQLRQIHKQSSLQYVVDDDYQQGHNEIMPEYMDDMYHSEDSGNYLNESSSGSVKGLATHQQQATATTTAATSLEDLHTQTKTLAPAISTTTTTMSVPSGAHQQIKKQGSIILEEDEKDDISVIAGLPDTVESPSKSVSRKSSHDILVGEHDEMGDLQLVSATLRSSQSRKMKLMRGETEEVVGGHMQIMKRKTEVTAKQRWHWAYNKIIMQLNEEKFQSCYKNYLKGETNLLCKSMETDYMAAQAALGCPTIP